MKYKCQICDREIDDFVALSHIKTEEYLMKLILKDHPEWHEKNPTCLKCITYYRKLINDSEV
jgi:DNA-directed RNA polymerase subunit RPC12/RpoP